MYIQMKNNSYKLLPNKVFLSKCCSEIKKDHDYEHRFTLFVQSSYQPTEKN